MTTLAEKEITLDIDFSDRNEDNLKKYFTEVHEKENFDIIDELVNSDVVLHLKEPRVDITGIEGFKTFVKMFRDDVENVKIEWKEIKKTNSKITFVLAYYCNLKEEEEELTVINANYWVFDDYGLVKEIGFLEE
eukprot:gene3451-6100_t